jgi:TfoX/Sxy family transcriptional regulator of competence genes
MAPTELKPHSSFNRTPKSGVLWRRPFAMRHRTAKPSAIAPRLTQPLRTRNCIHRTTSQKENLMASDQSYVEYVCEQASLGDLLSYKKMFGEFALYLEGKVIALVCDNQLFLKPTEEGKQLLGVVSEQSPYPGAKPQYLIGDELENRDLLKRLFLATARALPPPKAKAVKRKPKTK